MNSNVDPEILDAVIIGGGPAGLTAGIYAKRAAMNVVLIEKGATGGQISISDEIENWPGTPRIGGLELAKQFTEHAQSYGLKTISSEVLEIRPGSKAHTVRLSDDSELKTHSIIISTGGSPRKLDIPGETENYGKGVSYCATCDGFFFTDRTVVVVGGGDSATEEALYLAKIAKKVYLVHRRDTFRASMLLRERVENESKIEVIYNSVVAAIESDAHAVCSVKLRDTRDGGLTHVNTDGVFIFIGFEPNNALIPAGVHLSADGYVITDEKCETSVYGIFAVGDIREKYARQIVTAAGDGATATLAASHYIDEKKARASR